MRVPLPCQVVDRQAVRYFFHDVPDGVRSGMRLHLRYCPRCRRKLTLFGRVWRRAGERRAASESGQR